MTDRAPKVEILGSRVLLHQPSAIQVQAAQKAFQAMTGKRAWVWIRGMFPGTALRVWCEKGLDLTFPAEPGVRNWAAVKRVGRLYLQVDRPGAPEDVIPDRGQDVIVSLTMP